MHELTPSAVLSQPQAPTADAARAAFCAAAGERVAWWPAVGSAEQTAVADDWQRSGLPAVEYAAALADHPDFAAFVADAGLSLPGPTTAAPAAQPDGPEAHPGARLNRAAGKLLDRITASYGKAQAGWRDHLLACGKLCQEYVAMRTSPPLGHSRAAAVEAIRGRLSETSGTKVDVNRLIAVYQTVRLLGEGVDYTRVPYSTLREYTEFVHRDPATEQWHIQPGLEAEARQLFARASTSTPVMDRDAVEAAVKAVLARSWQAVADELARQAGRPDADPELTEAAEKAQAVAARAQAKQQKAEAAAASRKAERDPAGRKVPTPAVALPAAAHGPTNLLAVAKVGTAKDVGELVVQLVQGHKD